MFKSELYKSTLKVAAIGGLTMALSSSLFAEAAYSGLWNAKKRY